MKTMELQLIKLQQKLEVKYIEDIQKYEKLLKSGNITHLLFSFRAEAYKFIADEIKTILK